MKNKQTNDALRTKQCSKNKQPSLASGASAPETRIKFRLEKAMSPFGQKQMYSITAMRKQHWREAQTEGVRRRKDRK